MSKNKKHSLLSFQGEWLSDPAFRSWISKTKNAHKTCCFLCKTNFDISIMRVSALQSHAQGKKQQARASLLKVQSVYIRHFPSTKENSDDCGEPVPPTGFATAKTASVIVDLSKNLHRVDAKICWCLCMVNCCSSYKSCANLGAMFQVMFPESKIASQFTLGKTKARYTMLYGIAPEFKKQLIYDINASTFYTVSFDESLNSQVQMSQWMLECGIGIKERTLLKLTTLTQNS